MFCMKPGVPIDLGVFEFVDTILLADLDVHVVFPINDFVLEGPKR